jgi:hypothetical protein
MDERKPTKRLVKVLKHAVAIDAPQRSSMFKIYEVPERAIEVIQEDPGVEKEVKADGTRVTKANARPIHHTVTFGPLPLDRKLVVVGASFADAGNGGMATLTIETETVADLAEWRKAHRAEGWL